MIERVKLLLSVKNLSPAQLALSIGVQRSGISHILSGRNKPSLDFVMKILEVYPEINESWLLMGKGEMLKSSNSSPSLFLHDEKIEESKPEEKVVEQEIIAPIKNIEEEVMAPDEKKKDDIVSKELKSKENTQEAKMESIVNSIAHQSSAKKMVQLIAIYEDDSFKIFHSK